MKRSKFSEEQIVYAIRQAESGASGMSELRRLQQLEEENSRLKRLVVDLSLDKHMLSEALQKSLRHVRCRELAQWFRRLFRCGVRVPAGWQIQSSGLVSPKSGEGSIGTSVPHS